VDACRLRRRWLQYVSGLTMGSYQSGAKQSPGLGAGTIGRGGLKLRGRCSDHGRAHARYYLVSWLPCGNIRKDYAETFPANATVHGARCTNCAGCAAPPNGSSEVIGGKA
jgi:hypothetical protein